MHIASARVGKGMVTGRGKAHGTDGLSNVVKNHEVGNAGEPGQDIDGYAGENFRGACLHDDEDVFRRGR